MHEFKHPKYYTELRKRNKLDQAISLRESETSAGERSPGPGLSGKQQAASTHPDLLPNHGPEYYAPRRRKRQATSKGKLQATSSKRQASE
jgi:hypothetical protein